MDVASLIVRAGYDGAALTRGLAKSAADLQRFSGQFAALGSNAVRSFKLPDLDTQTAITQLKTLGVAMSDVKVGFADLGYSFDQTAQRFRNSTGRVVSEVEAMGAASQVIAKLASDAKALALNDDAVRSQVRILTEGARITATQSASLKELRGIYAQLSREVNASNVPLERRILLERELVRIRQQFASITAASRASVATEFVAAAAPVQRTARALGDASRQATGASRSFALINRQTGEFTQLGRRASGAAIGVAFGLEALARGGAAAEFGLRTALRAVAGFAAFFGPKGLIISGVAAATAAIIDLFRKSREKMEKTQDAFLTSLTEMVRSGDVVGVLKELQKIEIGELKLDPTTGLFEFSGGLKDLKKQLAELETAQDRLHQQNVARSGFTVQGQAIRQLREEIRPLQERYDQLVKTIRNFPELPRLPQLPQAIRVEGTSDAKLAEQAFARLREEVDNTSKSAAQLPRDFLAQERIGTKLLALHDQVTEQLKAQTDETSAAAVQLRDMLKMLEEIGILRTQLLRRKFPVVPEIDPQDIRSKIDQVIQNAPRNLEFPITLKPLIPDVNLRGFEAAVQRLRDAQNLVDFSQLTGDAGFQREAEQRLVAMQKRVQDYAQSVAVAMAVANVPLETQRRILAEIDRLTRGLKVGGEVAATMADSIHGITTAGRGLLQVADAMGSIDEQARRALEGVLQLADGLSVVRASKASLAGTLTGVVGIVGGLASLLQGIGVLGQSPAEQERQRLLRANNEELARLRLELSGFTGNIGQNLVLSADLLALTTGPGSRFKEQVEALGFTMAELAVLARRSGIEIFDSAGNIIPAALKAWGEALRLAAAEAIRFSESFADQRTAQELLNRARGLPASADQQIADSVALFKQFAPTLFEKYFAGVSFTDATAMRKAIERFVLDFISNAIDEQLFDGFADRSEVIAVIDAWLDGIDSMTDAANQVTEALLNVPTGFRVERARFEATLTKEADKLLKKGGGLFDRQPPFVVPITPSTGPTSFGGDTFNITAININAKDKSAGQIFEEIKHVVRQQARALGGLNASAVSVFDN